MSVALVCGCGGEKRPSAPKPVNAQGKPAIEKGQEPVAPAEKPTEKPEVKPEEKPAEKPEEKPAMKPEEKPAEKPAAKPEEKPQAKPEAKPATKPADKPAEKPAAKPVEKPQAKPEEKPAEKPAAKPDAKPAPAEKSGAAAKTDDLSDIPAVVWLPKPAIEIPEAQAKTEAEMKAYTEVIPNTDVKFDMVPIKAGKFLMGSPESEEGRWQRDADGELVKDKDGNKISNEGPQHEVQVGAFWMGKCEVTWDEYELWGLGLDKQRRAIKKIQTTEQDKLADAITLPTKPYTDMTFGMGKEGFPAVCMTQLAAEMYCKWLSAKTGRYYRLPTEAEWEYACRAGSKSAFSFGDDPKKLDEYAWYYDNSDEKYHKVGQKKPNAWGLYDMHGNVCEWVLDALDPDFYKTGVGRTTANPFAAPKTEYGRCVRGGSWDDDAPKLRSAARVGSNKDWKMQDPQIPQSIWYLTDADFVGFRVVRPIELPSPEVAKKYDPEPEVLAEYREAQAGKQ